MYCVRWSCSSAAAISDASPWPTPTTIAPPEPSRYRRPSASTIQAPSAETAVGTVRVTTRGNTWLMERSGILPFGFLQSVRQPLAPLGSEPADLLGPVRLRVGWDRRVVGGVLAVGHRPTSCGPRSGRALRGSARAPGASAPASRRA